MAVTDIKVARAERRRQAAQGRKRGEPEITKTGNIHLTGTCAGCRFWDTTDESVAVARGICRESSPQLVTVGSANGPIVQALWPITNFNAVCGRHAVPDQPE